LVREYQQMEADLSTLESRLDAKKEKLNRIARVLGKPQIEEPLRTLSARLIEDHGVDSVPNSPATIARALTGRGLSRS
jgi:hypothetical protein